MASMSHGNWGCCGPSCLFVHQGQSSVHLSGLSFCVCLFSSVLPSPLLLVSSSLTCWQDEVPRLPTRSPQPEVCPWCGWGGWLATAWPCGPQSKWTDTSSPCSPGCGSGVQTPLSLEGAPTCMGVPGLLVVGVSGLLWAVRRLLCPICLCRVSVPFSATSCASSSSLTTPPRESACCVGWGLCHCGGSRWAESPVLPRPGSIPVPWGAVRVRGSVRREEWGGRVRVPAGVLGRLRPCVRQ